MSKEKAIDILARTIWGEARGEGPAGMEAVAWVVLNRLAISGKRGGHWWGNNIISICQKPFQFSVWNEKDSNHQRIMEVTPADKIFAECLEIAEAAIDRNLGHDNTGGATHYHALRIKDPFWADPGKQTGIIGNHIFYRLAKTSPVSNRTLKQPKITPISLTDKQRKKHSIKRAEAYRLDEDYIYEWEGPDGLSRRIMVPAGLIYDGASVPRLAWTISGILPDGLIRAAALIHDWLYIYKGRLPEGSYQVKINGKWENTTSLWKRKDSDKLFCRIMREAGVSRFRRRMAYRGVRLGGWLAWRT